MSQNNESPNYFGECLRKIRRSKKLAQKVVAILAGLDQSYLAGLEAGRRPLPRDKQLKRLTDALQATEIEMQALRDARAISKLLSVTDQFQPEQAKSLAEIACRFQHLSATDRTIVAKMAEMLEQR